MIQDIEKAKSNCQNTSVKKHIKTAEDLNAFMKSSHQASLINLIKQLQKVCIGKTHDENKSVPSTAIQCNLKLLAFLNNLIDEVKPEPSQGRFGNVAFRTLHDRLDAEIDPYIVEIVKLAPNQNDEQQKAIVQEVRGYLLDCLGNCDRLDQGTGHELHQFCFLQCQFQLGILGEPDCLNTVHKVFFSQMKIAYRIQTTYCLEPAGTHGVWNLDDQQFLPQVFGVAELKDRVEEFPVAVIVDIAKIQRHKDKFMLFWQVNNTIAVKGPNLQTHSPTYQNISGVKFQNKLLDGMIKMFTGEVTSKQPIMNHFLSGTIIKVKDE